MKKNKKILGATLAVFAVFIMVSSATVVPAVNIEAVENTKTKKVTDLLQASNELDVLNSEPTEVNPEDLLAKCWEYWEDPEVRQAITQAKDTIEYEINSRFTDETTRENVKELLDLENIFNLSAIKSRIESVHILTYMDDLQDLMGVTDNHGEFNSTYKDIEKKLLETWYDSGESWDNFSGMFYPLVDIICNILGAIALIWLIPITIFFGLIGLMIAIEMTFVFFGPITFPLVIYIATVELLKNDKEFRSWLFQITILYGLFGLLSQGLFATIKKIRDDGWMDLAREYVHSRILFMNLIKIPEGWEVETGETAPFSSGELIVKKDGIVHLSVDVDDDDEFYYKNGLTVYEAPRDYLQLGIDWDNDGEFDEWTELCHYTWYKVFYIYAEPHDYGKPGTYTIRYAPRDMWGVMGETKTVTVTLAKEKSTNQYLNLLSNFPILRAMFARFSPLLERLAYV